MAVPKVVLMAVQWDWSGVMWAAGKAGLKAAARAASRVVPSVAARAALWDFWRAGGRADVRADKRVGGMVVLKVVP